MKSISILLCLLFGVGSLLAQTSLSGKVTDKEGEPLIFGNVGIYKDGNLVTGTDTDFDGFYSFINLDPGTYDVEVSYVGYQSRKIEGVEVLEGRANHLDIEMDAGSVLLNEITVVAYKVPLIEQDNMTSGSVISRNDIRNLPTRKINSLAAATAGLSSGKGDDIVVRGSRSNHSSNDEYAPIIENPVIKSEEEAVSTFSIDVDRAAYSQVRSYLKRQQLPPVDLVRTEELINYFGYEYAQPTDGQPFSITTELGDCPWNESHQLLHIGIQGENLNLHQAPANNLVFLIDVSGSMNASNKLPLVKKSIGILIENLRPMDRVAIVVYAGSAGLVLPSTSGQDKAQIKAALEKLTSGGSTAGGQGIKLAYQIARENLLEGGNNRVILATDGDFNVGISGLNQLEKLVEKEREKGVSLTVLGFGMGNYKDNRLELLADKGNGNYAFIDNIGEARKMFDTELTGTLYTIAKDVKLQLHFDPKRVVSYRLIGYENRLLNKKDFDDDSKDAGELGAGHTVTALYELELRPGTQTIAEFQLRYKLPRGRQSHLLSHQLPSSVKKLESCSENFRFAASVAGFSLLLRNSANKGNLTFDETLALAKGALGDDPYGYRQEFLELVRIAKDIGLVAEK